jgi:enamine deaminase RidA (YjgF/YER057c/UK114 family)
MENAGELLATAGLTHRDVVSSKIYLTPGADFAAMNEVYREFFPEAPPARATVQSGLAGPEAVVEITFVASSAAERDRDAAIRVAAQPGDSCRPTPVRFRHARQQSGYGRRCRGADARDALRIDATLRDAGLSRGDVVDALVYITDAASFGAMNGEYRAFFGSDFPARATVVTPLVRPGRARRDHGHGRSPGRGGQWIPSLTIGPGSAFPPACSATRSASTAATSEIRFS